MGNLNNANKSINSLSNEAVDGKELKGGGAPGSVDPMDVGETGWIDPNTGDMIHPMPALGPNNGEVDPANPSGIVPVPSPLDNGPVGQILPPTVV